MYSRPLALVSCHPYWMEDLVKDHTVARSTEEECLEAALCKRAVTTAAETTVDMVTEMTTDMDLEAEEAAMDLLEVEVEAGQVGSGLGWRIGIYAGFQDCAFCQPASVYAIRKQSVTERDLLVRSALQPILFYGSS